MICSKLDCGRRKDDSKLSGTVPSPTELPLVATSRRVVRTVCRAAPRKRFRFTSLKATCEYVVCYSIWQRRLLLITRNYPQITQIPQIRVKHYRPTPFCSWGRVIRRSC